MRKFATLFLLLFGLSAAPAVAATGILDGLTFTGDIGSKGQAADGKDDIIFANAHCARPRATSTGSVPARTPLFATVMSSRSRRRRRAGPAGRSTGRARSATECSKARLPASRR
jgi:hypothetical protein